MKLAELGSVTSRETLECIDDCHTRAGNGLMSATDLPLHEHRVTRLPWDSGHFGFPIASVSPGSLDLSLAERVADECRTGAIRCLYFFADASDAGSCCSAATIGLRFVEARLSYVLALGRQSEQVGTPFLDVDPAKPEDLEHLRAMAKGAFQGTRFFRDPGFPRERVSAMYERWVDRDLSEGGVLVARGADRSPEGFVTWRPDGERVVIGLIAVAQHVRGRGVGRRLLVALEDVATARGASIIVVTTQGDNLVAQRLYQAAGYRSHKVEYCFHAWFDSNER